MSEAENTPWVILAKDRGMGHYGPFRIMDAKGQIVVAEITDPATAKRIVDAVNATQGWQDISTAPKDRTYVWVSNGFSQRIAFWMEGKEYECQGSVGGGWRDLALAERCRGTADLMFAPTHWCHLPVPPTRMIADQHGEKK